MSRTTKATALSSHRRFSSLYTSPPPVAAVLDMAKPGERAAHALLRRFSSGRWPTWRPLAVCRSADALMLAVEWHPRAHRRPHRLGPLSNSWDRILIPRR